MPKKIDVIGGPEDDEIITVHEPVAQYTLDRLLGSHHNGGAKGMSIEAASLWRDALKGVKFLHDRRWIHRDLKPRNIGVINSSRAVLLDLGTAEELMEPEYLAPSQPGNGGTIGYLSPERELQPYDEADDIWAMGVIGFQLMYGDNPFRSQKNPWRQGSDEYLRKEFTLRYEKAMARLADDYRAAQRSPNEGYIHMGPLVIEMLKFPKLRYAFNTMPSYNGPRIKINEALSHPTWGEKFLDGKLEFKRFAIAPPGGDPELGSTAGPNHGGPKTSLAGPGKPEEAQRGIVDTTLTLPEQMSLLSNLFRVCHSAARLARENYPLAASSGFRVTPPRDPQSPKRPAVVLDCEMAGTDKGDQAITLSLIDFVTGATLVNSFVQPGPDVKVLTWRTPITGIDEDTMKDAVARGEALRGQEEAAGRVLDFVDADTVVVGHAVKYDLKVLGLAHGRVVDSAILVGEASGMFKHDKEIRGVGLELLCKELVGLKIRKGSKGKKGKKEKKGKAKRVHDSLEDVMATRKLVIWCLSHRKELRTWARKYFWAKEREKHKKEARRARKESKERKKQRQKEKKARKKKEKEEREKKAKEAEEAKEAMGAQEVKEVTEAKEATESVCRMQ
ncbi:hypothetical protein VTH06DRAFT_6399 [Thermothelomyces fergusii]